MRAKEFISEMKIDVPDQMVSVQVPLATLLHSTQSQLVNPGKRAGEDGKYKWSPPLQQHLDAVKDSVGPSTNDTEESDEVLNIDDDSSEETYRNKLTSILSKAPGFIE